MRYALLEDPAFLPQEERKRVVTNLKKLREQLDADVGPKDMDDSLLLATWNIRDLGKLNRRGYGERLPESYFYIAEVLSHFDFVAVQEVNELDEWEKIVEILGPEWGWIATDVTHPSLGGNGERLTYLFDRRKVSFRNVAGEIVLPANLLISASVEPKEGDDEETVEVDHREVGKQFRRTPYNALFQASWFKFEICTVHIYYGSGSGKKLDERVEEIETVASYFGKRAEDAFKDGRSLILLGDFNVVGHDHKTMDALLKSKFVAPKAMQTLRGTNVDGSKFYDQIVFRARPGDLAFVEKPEGAGVVEIFENVFTEDRLGDYEAAAASSPNGEGLQGEALQKYYDDWKTYQFSDHLPLWVRLQIDRAENYLDEIGR
jgi:endonuclease/exonuclease/phosphatase family metal-dependent hydrolase